jgi:uncharacterized protein (TIGR02246 family)
LVLAERLMENSHCTKKRRDTMKYTMSILVVCGAFMCAFPTTSAADQTADKAAIEKAVTSYTAAFNARDAKALAAHWSPDAVYINPLTGSQVEGREAIVKEFEAILSELKETKLAVDVESIQFISPGVAVENGVAKLISADGQPEESSYTAIHVKHNGKWLLDRVTEEDVPVVLSHYEQLKELEWMIGTWVDGDDQASIKTTCQWTRNKNFITRSFTVSIRDRIDMAGMQIIGWDPAAKQIRSWVFDSDGGFAEGRWTRNKKGWSIITTGTLADGGKASSVNVITRVDDDQFKWKSLNRTAGGELLPNIDEVVVVRGQSAE